ncbi:MAG TPA: hypothetical protein VN520_07385 [Streptomyces sp.]|uniref:hypothetical protein n=1 Tax=Streptomyces sp. TaxID=1931 RepID=UPI002BE667B3|nr:hypothetical protein [Streptomyces sp.]HWU06202.1 hypothetical protein [Streptomyces sp.]
MKRVISAAVLVGAGAIALLSGCTGEEAADPGRALATAGPTATVAPGAAAQVAERYRAAGGAQTVYGIQRSDGPDGVPVLVVWTRDPDNSARTFEELKEPVAGYLERGEGLSLDEGCPMDVFGPDGSLQHRLDARP